MILLSAFFIDSVFIFVATLSARFLLKFYQVPLPLDLLIITGGRRGIRTLAPLRGLSVFKTELFSRLSILPYGWNGQNRTVISGATIQHSNH